MLRYGVYWERSARGGLVCAEKVSVRLWQTAMSVWNKQLGSRTPGRARTKRIGAL